MSNISQLFGNLEKFVTIEQKRFLLSSECKKPKEKYNSFKHVKKITTTINSISDILKRDETILISIKHQKLLRSSFQMIIALGTSQCLIPGVGVNLSKRCAYAEQFKNNNLDDDQKYKLLTLCADFFARSYTIPVLKNIICTFHLSDYLASLIQLAFAPLKNPGTYRNYIMTQSRYDQLSFERQKYIAIYENLIQNCFQPFLMKELLVLQSVTDPAAPTFVKLTVTKTLNKRLIAPGGLLSLIRSFLENYGPDTGYDWKKIDTICKIVTADHGILSDAEYVDNMCSQISQILSLTNSRYIMTASACIYSLKEKYKEHESVKNLTDELFIKFDYIKMVNTATIDNLLMSNQEIEHNLKILHISLCVAQLDWPPVMWSNNMFVLFMLGMKSEPTSELNEKIRPIIFKCLESCNKSNMINIIQMLLFGFDGHSNIYVEELEAGIVLKFTQQGINYPKELALKFFLDIFSQCTSANTIQDIFQSCLNLVVELINKRSEINSGGLDKLENYSKVINDVNEKYAITLQLLSEISTLPKIVASLKTNPEIVLEFIHYILMKSSDNPNDECVLVSLVLLNTVLANIKAKDVRSRFAKLIPYLKKMQYSNSDYVSILCQEAVTMISEDKISTPTALSKAIRNVFDKLLPVRAHGIMEITKLIQSKDVETLAKKHYIFCLLQEQLKNTDSYIYLASINCIAALGAHCAEDVLHVLCTEFLDGLTDEHNIETKESMNRSLEHRMKVGEIIVKVIKSLGNMAVEHKTILLNTMLSACRDPEPMIRTSALSNLAEVARVINYQIGPIIQEVLRCVWSVLESDNAIECRRAAVMVIASLIKGLGKETLLDLKDNLLPVYRTLKSLYDDPNEDHILKLHAQIGLEELNSIVTTILFNKIDLGDKLVLEHKAG